MTEYHTYIKGVFMSLSQLVTKWNAFNGDKAPLRIKKLVLVPTGIAVRVGELKISMQMYVQMFPAKLLCSLYPNMIIWRLESFVDTYYSMWKVDKLLEGTASDTQTAGEYIYRITDSDYFDSSEKGVPTVDQFLRSVTINNLLCNLEGIYPERAVKSYMESALSLIGGEA